jgi:hypothetical protein
MITQCKIILYMLTKYFKGMWGAIGAGDDGGSQRGLEGHGGDEEDGEYLGSRGGW